MFIQTATLTTGSTPRDYLRAGSTCLAKVASERTYEAGSARVLCRTGICSVRGSALARFPEAGGGWRARMIWSPYVRPMLRSLRISAPISAEALLAAGEIPRRNLRAGIR